METAVFRATRTVVAHCVERAPTSAKPPKRTFAKVGLTHFAPALLRYSPDDEPGGAASAHMGGPYYASLPILDSLRHFAKLQELSRQLTKVSFYFKRCGTKELPPLVHNVDAATDKSLMHRRLNSHSIARKKQCMHVEIEWYGGVTEFADTIHGIETSGHSDLYHFLSKRPNIRYNVDISCA